MEESYVGSPKKQRVVMLFYVGIQYTIATKVLKILQLELMKRSFQNKGQIHISNSSVSPANLFEQLTASAYFTVAG